MLPVAGACTGRIAWRKSLDMSPLHGASGHQRERTRNVPPCREETPCLQEPRWSDAWLLASVTMLSAKKKAKLASRTRAFRSCNAYVNDRTRFVQIRFRMGVLAVTVSALQKLLDWKALTAASVLDFRYPLPRGVAGVADGKDCLSIGGSWCANSAAFGGTSSLQTSFRTPRDRETVSETVGKVIMLSGQSALTKADSTADFR